MVSRRLFVLVGLAFASLWPPAEAAEPTIARGIVPVPEGQTNHAPGLVELTDGRLLVCWYSGTSEANEDTRILCSDSTDRGGSWSLPRVVVDRGEQAFGAEAANKSPGNVTLHFDGRGRLWLIYGVIQRWDWPLIGNVCRNWLCGRVDAKVSADLGETWSAAVRLDDQTGALPRAKPVHVDRLGDILPLYREGDETAYLRIVDLAAMSPGQSLPLPSGLVVPLVGEALIQPSLVVQPNGLIRAYLRDSRSASVFTALFDPASGLAAPAVPTNLPNPGAAVDAWLDDASRFVLVYNPSTGDRHSLSLAQSTDGVHFHPGCDLVASGAEGDVAYPTVIRSANGDWHVVYSSDGKTRIQHVRFNAAWLDHCLAARN